MRFEKKRYRGEPVALDGNEYVGCTFDSCTFVYSATGRFALDSNSISNDCRFEFSGAAADTVATMQAIYRMGDWGGNHILATFQQIAPGLQKLN